MSDVKIPSKLLWVDLEMTGLDPSEDVILEIAAEVTDFNFKTIDHYEAVIAQPKDVVVDRMHKNSWWQEYPENRNQLLEKMATGRDLLLAQDDLLKLVSEHFGSEPAVLAGNSIHSDRKFIATYWPELDLKLHYRMLDVSAWKILMQGKFGVEFEKKNVHRAFDDIQASIAELAFYLEWFGTHPSDVNG